MIPLASIRSDLYMVADFFRKVVTKEPGYVAAAFATAFLVCFVLIPVIIRLSAKYQLVDQPNERKVHKVPISRLGGIGIVTGVLLSSPIWFSSGEYVKLMHILGGMVILIILGVVDDLRELSPKIKFIGQFIAALFLAHSGLLIDNLFGIFGIGHLPLVIQYALTVLIVAGVINAFNLIDGIDGLAGGLAMIDMVGFFILFTVAEHQASVLISVSVIGALLAFLRYNYHPAKIFMGDTGSMFLGYILAAMGIEVLVMSRSAAPYFYYDETAIMVISIFILPVYDTLRVFAGRIINRKSPFKPDKTHIHHLLMKTGFNHPRSAKILYSANIVLIITGFLLRSQPVALVASLLILETILFSEFLTLYKLIKARLTGKKLQDKATGIKMDNRLLIDNLEEKDGK